MKKYLLLIKLLTLVMLVSCAESEERSTSAQQKKEPVQLTESMKEKVKQDNNFAFDLFKEVYKEQPTGNVFISPLSVSMALSMTMNGAQGRTYDEMRTTLRADNMTRYENNNYSKALRENLLNADSNTEVAIANSIWYREDFPVKSTFIESSKLYFNAEVNAADFADPNTINVINAWCSDNTNNKIPKVINNTSGIMYLINAVCFNGTWKYEFDKKTTFLENFRNEDGTNDKVQMMHQTHDFEYAQGEHASYLKLPYGNGNYNMIIVLPDNDITIETFISTIYADDIASMTWDKKFPVVLSLPRFKTECEYELTDDILPAMGMNIPFTNMADFSGISDMPINISTVIHKTFVDVTEEGTESAGVTVVGMEDTVAPPEEQRFFSVNRPFMFMIQEDTTGAILFMGKIGKVL